MFWFFKCRTKKDAPDYVIDEILADNADLLLQLNAAYAENSDLYDQLTEARRQSDAFEKIAAEACAEIETLRRTEKRAAKRKVAQ